MSFEMRKAKRSKRPLKFEFQGVTGSGKTYSALRLAHYLRRIGVCKKFALGDSENNSGDLYQGIQIDGETWDYDLFQIPPEKQNPLGYIDAYEYAIAQGCDLVIMDSTTHMWKGALKRVDEIGAANRGDKFGAGWKTVSPEMERLIRTITDDRAHIITTSRVKTEWEVGVKENGKKSIQKLGTKADQRDGVEYEFDCVVRFDEDNLAVIEKVRGCPQMHKAHCQKPGPEFWEPLVKWWQSGAEVLTLFQRLEERLRLADTLAELQEAWGKVNAAKDKLAAEEFRQLEELKNKKKEELTPKG
jgi:hypothetical protein